MDYSEAARQVIFNGRTVGKESYPIGRFLEARAVDSVSPGHLSVVGTAIHWPGNTATSFIGSGDVSISYRPPMSWPDPDSKGSFGSGTIEDKYVDRMIDYTVPELRGHLGEPNFEFWRSLQRLYELRVFPSGVMDIAQITKVTAALEAGLFPQMEFTGDAAWDTIANEMFGVFDAYINRSIAQGQINIDMINERIELWESVEGALKSAQRLPSAIAGFGIDGIVGFIKANPLAFLVVGAVGIAYLTYLSKGVPK